MYKILNWFSLTWWKYLLEKPTTWKKFWCRANYHKCGPNYYTTHPEATEPDWTCKNCEDYLG